MITRLYVNNFRCLVNFELKFDPMTLLLGPNGAGKTSVMDAIQRIRDLVSLNATIRQAFPQDTVTSWVKTRTQDFELEMQLSDVVYTYTLVVGHTDDKTKNRIERELLLYDGKKLFEFTMGEVQLYRDDFGMGPTYTFDWSMSALATIVSRSDNKKLTTFRDALQSVVLLSLDPRKMGGQTDTEIAVLDRDGKNYASWYRYALMEFQDRVMELTERLREVLPGFHAFKLEQAGRARILKVGFRGDDESGNVNFYEFEQLSDGQRVLIVLYSLLGGLNDPHAIMILDEPENYLALPEIQPWLMSLTDHCDAASNQAILISHHPELIDYLGSEQGIWIEREAEKPARVQQLSSHPHETLKLSESIARGWPA